MGAAARTHRFRTPLALAVVLALTGALPAATRPDAAGQVASPSADQRPQPASVTRIEPRPYPSSGPDTALAAPVRISATSGHGRAVRVDVSDVLLRAYRSAAAGAPSSCHLPVSLLAAIGQVESGSLVDATLDRRHRTSILGPVLDGRHGFRAIRDTDRGRWDGSRRWDRAVGPLQFIPSTWRQYGVDGDGDGATDPQDVEDATATATAYLCSGGRDLSRAGTMRTAVLAYNASAAYEALVMTYQRRFAALGLDRAAHVVGLSTAVSALGSPVSGHALGETALLRRGSSTTSSAALRETARVAAVRRSLGLSGSVGPDGAPASGRGSSHPSSSSRRPTPGHHSRGPSTGPTATSVATSVATATATAMATATAVATAHPTATPTGSASPTGSPSPTGTPTDDPTSCPPEPTPTATPSAEPTPTDSDTTATCPPCSGDPTDPGSTPTASATPSPVADDGAQPDGSTTGTAPTCAVDPATAASPSAAP